MRISPRLAALSLTIRLLLFAAIAAALCFWYSLSAPPDIQVRWEDDWVTQVREFQIPKDAEPATITDTRTSRRFRVINKSDSHCLVGWYDPSAPLPRAAAPGIPSLAALRERDVPPNSERLYEAVVQKGAPLSASLVALRQRFVSPDSKTLSELNVPRADRPKKGIRIVLVKMSHRELKERLEFHRNHPYAKWLRPINRKEIDLPDN